MMVCIQNAIYSKNDSTDFQVLYTSVSIKHSIFYAIIVIIKM